MLLYHPPPNYAKLLLEKKPVPQLDFERSKSADSCNCILKGVPTNCNSMRALGQVQLHKDDDPKPENCSCKSSSYQNNLQVAAYHPNKENYQINCEKKFFGTVTGYQSPNNSRRPFCRYRYFFYRPKFSVICFFGAPRCGSGPNWCLEGPPHPPLQLEDPSLKPKPFPPRPLPPSSPHPLGSFCNAPGRWCGGRGPRVQGGGGGGEGPPAGLGARPTSGATRFLPI